MIAARRAHPKFPVCKSNSFYFSSDRSISLLKTNSLTFRVYDRFQIVFEILRLLIFRKEISLELEARMVVLFATEMLCVKLLNIAF